MAATALVRLGRLTGEQRYLDAAHATLQMATDVMQRSPAAVGQMLIAADMYLGPFTEFAVVAAESTTPADEVIAGYWQQFLPNSVIACRGGPRSGNSLRTTRRALRRS